MLTSGVMEDASAARSLLEWYLEVGVDEAVDEKPHDRYRESLAAPAQAPSQAPSQALSQAPPRAGASLFAAAPQQAPTPAARSARSLAEASDSLEALKTAVESFDGCPLKQTATTTVIGDGNPEAAIMLIGEAPGAEEDRQGLPFVGPAGHLLNRMLEAIGLDRSQVYITNVLPWRPPGNRSPTAEEIAACLPFVERQIEIVGPRVLIIVGGISAKALLGRSEGITKLRGKWLSYTTPSGVLTVDTMAIFHTAYLLRQPALKRQAWQDMLEIKEKIKTDD